MLKIRLPVNICEIVTFFLLERRNTAKVAERELKANFVRLRRLRPFSVLGANEILFESQEPRREGGGFPDSLSRGERKRIPASETVA